MWVLMLNDEVMVLCEDWRGNFWVVMNGGGLNWLWLKVYWLYD